MRLTDIAPIEKWVQLEKKVHEYSELTVGVFDPDGARITDYVNWANRLCPAIKSTPKGRTYICSVAHQNISKQAVKSAQMVIDSCDAGMTKIVVPVFIGDNCVGVVSGCGLLSDKDDLESFLINAVTGIDAGEIASLAMGLGTLSHEGAVSVGGLMQQGVDELIAGFESAQNENFVDRR